MSRVISLLEVREADYNLSPSLFVEANGRAVHRSLASIVNDLAEVRSQRERSDKELDELLGKLRLDGAAR
jgi:type I restriction enzyme M protein